jgi:hypothetical protein
MKLKKLSIAVVAIVILILLIAAFISALPYTRVGNLKFDQSFSEKGIVITLSNPTGDIIIFPKTQTKVYLDGVFFGDLYIEETTVKPNETVIAKSNFNMSEGISNTTAINPSKATFEGVSTVYLFGMPSNIPFKLERQVS